MLLLHFDAGLAQPVGEGVFVHLFQVTVPVIDVNGVSGFPHDVTEFIDRFHLCVPCVLSWPFNSSGLVRHLPAMRGWWIESRRCQGLAKFHVCVPRTTVTPETSERVIVRRSAPD